MPATLLCVDDEPNILGALRRLFRPDGYTVLCAGSGAEGLEILAREPVDLVISDMRMSHMSGAEFLAQVRSLWPQTVRILLTGHSDIASTIAAINAGQIARYVTKPWNDEEMRLIVREALVHKHLTAEKERLEALTLAQNDELKALNVALEGRVEARTAQLAAALKTVTAGRATLHRGMLNSVRGFAGVIELRRSVLAAHCRRVAERSRATAQALGMSGPDLQNLTIAALVHDIGMLSLSDAALATPERALAGTDLVEYAKHPAHGADLLATMEPLRDAADLVRAHHERFDGAGFPGQRAADKIPLGARILAVADDFDALINGLMTRMPMHEEDALAHLRIGSGKRYDPRVVEAYCSLYDPSRSAPAPRPERVLRCAELEPGMVLARDIISPDGKLLLAGDYALDAELIDGLVKFERASGSSLQIGVRLPPQTVALAAA